MSRSELNGDVVPLSELERTTVRMFIAPLPTVFMFAMGAMAMRGEVSGVGPIAWKREVRLELRERDVRTLTPLADPRTTGWPEVLSLGRRRPGYVPFNESLEAILELPPEELLAELDAAQGVQPDSWNDARRDPTRWIRDYGSAMRRVWSVIEPLWERSRDLLDREAERIGAAHALGATAEGLNSLHTRSAIKGDEWRLPTVTVADAARYRMRSQFLIAPLVVEDAMAIAAEPAGESGSPVLTDMLYPLPGAWRTFAGEPAPPATLEALLGDQRAKILARLDRPTTAGEIADAMYATASAATYQLRMLESADLVARSRRGRHVVVERTRRGTRLLELYDRDQ